MRSSIAQSLKQHTAPHHDRVEAGLGLLGGDLSADRMRVVLSRFAGFWQGTEPHLDAWAARVPDSADAVNWSRRRRLGVLRRDLLALGLSVAEFDGLPHAPAVFAAPGEAELLGWLYVSEGSTLGGAVIDRALRGRSTGFRGPLRTFTPYVEGPGPMWKGYLERVQCWVATDEARHAAVLAAAVSTFAALERWLAPIAVDEAA